MSMDETNMEGAYLARVIGDCYSRKILMATHNRPRTASELSQLHGIPIAACYRRIRELESAGLLCRAEHVLTSRGKRRWAYLSNVNSLEMFYRTGRLIVSCELRNGRTCRETVDAHEP